MRIPAIRGIIDRRVLVNFRVDARVLARICPPPFRPQTVDGFGVAGICLIRLKSIRPKRLPAWVGIASENAAHRIAVEWDVEGVTRSGVYIPRRDTSSLLNVFAGGRVFPGVHHHARFDVHETKNDLRIAMVGVDGSASVHVEGRIAEQLPGDSVFQTLEQCSQFFEAGSLGYSPASSGGNFDGLRLRTSDWQVQPLAVTRVQSSFFDDVDVFPRGSVVFDNALVMRGICHEWHSREPICCAGDSLPCA
ncbi:DUF2071 domain-containing protein [Rhodopirellula bahusiensis]|uniref:DUF2071 domain-containing protein n=1 Tax=Rhodopirellula bahusiensis TaxID=2014065 RepID=A0A2G1VYQ3_9BACT|nr:DUF2071 domain-containing protein [Rhodopirellula bahusiensis]PHQ31861.1 hypothetical protein CEE69_28730 [Rhodopirellula bahusiensis]